MHDKYLLAALQQAQLSRGQCAPNPSVAAVAVQNGKIIAQARHLGAGTPHAEQLLLSQLQDKLPGITIYVSLEPCNHWGKTPPCVDALIEYGVERVVYGYSDPNPIVANNNSPELLKAHGIDVIHYPMAEIDAFYQSYSYWHQYKKPWVTAKIAQSLDGKISGDNGQPLTISNSCCALFTHNLRLQSDIILSSAATVKKDNPLFNARPHGMGIAKKIALIDTRAELDSSFQLFSKASEVHLFYDEQLKKPKSLQDNCFYHALPVINGSIDLEKLIFKLGSLGFHDVFVEAGGRLFTALHQAGLVNQTYIYLAPKVLGPNSYDAYHQPLQFEKSCKTEWLIMDDNVVLSMAWEDSSCSQV